jgi:hypothetical protein
MLSIVMLKVGSLSFVMLSTVMLSVCSPLTDLEQINCQTDIFCDDTSNNIGSWMTDIFEK